MNSITRRWFCIVSMLSTSTLLAFLISSKASSIQLEMWISSGVPSAIGTLVGYSNLIFTILPLLFFFFIYSTSRIVLVEICDINVNKLSLACWLSISLLPVILNLGVTLYNVNQYFPNLERLDNSSIMHHQYIMGMTYESVTMVGRLCLVLSYGIYTACLRFIEGIGLLYALTASIFPSCILVLLLNTI